MVATRRGVRGSSPNIEENVPSVSMEATPSTRRTERRAVREESQSEDTSRSQHEGGKEGSAISSPETKGSTVKRKPRSSKRQVRIEDQPDSTHEADVSESESCCSVISDLQAPPDVQGTRHRRRGALALQKPGTGKEQDVLSEAESCCSSASAHQGEGTARATRSRQRSVPVEGQTAKCAIADNENSEAESCSSAVSLTRVLTRSQKRVTLSRASSKSRTEDTEVSEVDSCCSSLSGLQQSALRRSTRSRRGPATQAVPMCLEENAGGSPLPRRQTRGSRAKSEPAHEPQPHDSDGFESGPSMTPRRSTRNRAASVPQGQVILSDSESEANIYSPLGSPSSLRGKGTPSSSRTGSGSSVGALSVPQIAEKALNVLKEQEDCDASASSGPLIGEQPGNQGEKQVESGMADGPSDGQTDPCRYATVTVAVAEAAEAEDKEAVAMVVDVGPECSMIEEVSEDDKTLIAEEEERAGAAAVTVEDEAEPQIVREAPLVNVPICSSAEIEEENEEEEKATGDDLQVAHTLMEESRESETQSSKDEMITPGMLEEETDQDEQLHIAEDVVSPSPTVTVIVSDAALSEEEKVDDNAMDIHSSVATVESVSMVSDAALSEEKKVHDNAMDINSSVATVSQELQGVSEKDCSLAEEDVSVCVAEPCIKQKADYSLILLDSSDEEGEHSDGGHSGRKSGDEKDSKGPDSDEEINCPDEDLAGPSKPQAASPLPSNDGLFVIDTQPGFHSDGKYYLDQEKIGDYEGVAGEECDDVDDEEDEEFVDEEGDEDDDDDADYSILFKSKSKDLIKLSTSIDPGLKVKDIGGLYISVDGSKSKGASSAIQKLKEQKDQDGLMQKSIIGPDFEKKESVPPYKESKQALKVKRKAEREKTTGDGWFNMKAPEMTEELTNDLKVLKMRAAMDPKRFYKKNDRDGFPKYFQVGTVVDSPVDFYNSRVPKKQRKRTMVEELLADAEFRNYNKKKYKQIMTEKAARSAGKKNRKKNQFRKKQGD